MDPDDQRERLCSSEFYTGRVFIQKAEQQQPLATLNNEPHCEWSSQTMGYFEGCGTHINVLAPKIFRCNCWICTSKLEKHGNVTTEIKLLNDGLLLNILYEDC